MAAVHRPLLVKRNDVEGHYFVHDMSIDDEQTLKMRPLLNPAVGPLHYRPLAVAAGSGGGGPEILGVPPATATAGDVIMLAVGNEAVIKMDRVIYYREERSSSGFEVLRASASYNHGYRRTIPLPRPPFRTLRHPSQSVTIRAYFAMGNRVWISVAGEGTFSLDIEMGLNWQAEFPEELCRLEGRAFFAPELGAVVGLTGGDDRFLCSYKVDDVLRRSEVPMTWQHTWSEAVPWECVDMGPIGYEPCRDKASLAYLGDGTFCVSRPVKMLGTDNLNLNSYIVLQLRRRQPDGKSSR